MSDMLAAPAPVSPETAAAANPTAPAAPVADAKPTPHELRSGALWNDGRAAKWLGLAETDAPTAAAPVAEGDDTTAPATDAAETAEGEAKPDAPGYRRAGERGPKLELLGEDGQPVALDLATVKVRTKAGGEVVELAIPDLVRRAQSEAGLNRQVATMQQQIAGHEQARAQAVQEATEPLAAQTESVRAALLRSLTDETYRTQLVAELQAYLSPEQQLARVQAEREAERTQLAQTAAQQQHQTAATGFLSQVAPLLADLGTQFPHVTPEELAGHFHVLTAPMTGPDGRIAPQLWPQLYETLTTELPRLARARHEQIAALVAPAAQAATQRETDLAAATSRAQLAAQRATNQLASAQRPVGTPAGTAAPDAPRPRPKTLADAQASARATYAGLPAA